MATNYTAPCKILHVVYHAQIITVFSSCRSVTNLQKLHSTRNTMLCTSYSKKCKAFELQLSSLIIQELAFAAPSLLSHTPCSPLRLIRSSVLLREPRLDWRAAGLACRLIRLRGQQKTARAQKTAIPAEVGNVPHRFDIKWGLQVSQPEAQRSNCNAKFLQ